MAGDTFICACWDMIKCCLFFLITKEYSDINFLCKNYEMKGHFFFLRCNLFSLSFPLCLNSSWE